MSQFVFLLFDLWFAVISDEVVPAAEKLVWKDWASIIMASDKIYTPCRLDVNEIYGVLDYFLLYFRRKLLAPSFLDAILFFADFWRKTIARHTMISDAR